MTGIPWILISVLILLILLAVAAIVITRKHKRPTDYYSLFMMGIIWTAVGVPLKNYALSAMGMVFLIIGLVHRKEWKKNRATWDKLTAPERKLRLWVMVILGLLVFAGVLVLFLIR